VFYTLFFSWCCWCSGTLPCYFHLRWYFFHWSPHGINTETDILMRAGIFLLAFSIDSPHGSGSLGRTAATNGHDSLYIQFTWRSGTTPRPYWRVIAVQSHRFIYGLYVTHYYQVTFKNKWNFTFITINTITSHRQCRNLCVTYQIKFISFFTYLEWFVSWRCWLRFYAYYFGKYYPRIAFGNEGESWGKEGEPCGDCRVAEGQYHVQGCNIEAVLSVVVKYLHVVVNYHN